jgi:hypothetical protein
MLMILIEESTTPLNGSCMCKECVFAVCTRHSVTENNLTDTKVNKKKKDEQYHDARSDTG